MKTITGDRKFSDITRGRGATYEDFLESGKRDGLLRLIRKLRESMEGNFEMLTSEVISTNRVGYGAPKTCCASTAALRFSGATPAPR